jgi:predicted acylesterase/phospholipase RssA
LASAAWTLAATTGRALVPGQTMTGRRPRLRRPTRTDALAAVLAGRVFADRRLDEVTHSGLQVVLTACDLRSSNALRFGSARSSCSPYGVIVEPVEVATAVAASAAFPLLLPAMERTFTFRDDRAGREERQVVVLADGGVYDNLALSPLEPGRSPLYTAQVYPVRYVVACDAGRGPLAPVMPQLWPQRVQRSFDVVHRRAQDAGRARLHQATEAGQLDGFVLAYLGMRDERLPVPVADLIPRARVAGYPTDFNAMTKADLDLLALRGEQLARTLLHTYCPQLA